jgi:hypothetical protein
LVHGWIDCVNCNKNKIRIQFFAPNQKGQIMRFSLAICGALMLAFLVIQPAYGQYNRADSKDSLARAQADQAVAKANIEEAESRFGVVGKGIRSVFEASPEYIAAQDSFTTASSDREAERKKALDQLHGTTEYQNATAAHDRATQAVQDDRDAGAAPGVIMLDATAAMKAGQAVTLLDANATKNDADYQADKKKLDDARLVVDKLEQRYKLSLLSNPNWQSAKGDLDKSRAQLTAADGALAAAANLEQQLEAQHEQEEGNRALREQNAANANRNHH